MAKGGITSFCKRGGPPESDRGECSYLKCPLDWGLSTATPAASQTCSTLPSLAMSPIVWILHHENLCPQGHFSQPAWEAKISAEPGSCRSFSAMHVSSSEMTLFKKNQPCCLNYYSGYLRSPQPLSITLPWDFQHPCWPQLPQPSRPGLLPVKGMGSL